MVGRNSKIKAEILGSDLVLVHFPADSPMHFNWAMLSKLHHGYQWTLHQQDIRRTLRLCIPNTSVRTLGHKGTVSESGGFLVYCK